MPPSMRQRDPFRCCIRVTAWLFESGYRREGYDYDCVMPLYQFARDFSLVQSVPRGKPASNAKAEANIRKMKNMINAFRGKK
ncbi:DUF4222 domain-containing protein [Escherichia coli]|nr:DUF4222 domain-containing protein [Escherichia coli]EFH0302537.1 DUF4222 domain-containing protein [Escherichia coli]EFH0809032.1 DUF4222 domain-containing protein [Escherichia coli]EFH0907869.1 DUF4222 domain-containing protein [Escherichia coli]EHP9775895.1 DUF4222 domain-containing protein [Escherichia coli]